MSTVVLNDLYVLALEVVVTIAVANYKPKFTLGTDFPLPNVRRNTVLVVHSIPEGSRGFVVFFTLTDRASTIPSNIYVVANPVRGMLDRKR